MIFNLSITTASEYFNEECKEIDWEEDDNTKVPVEQAEALQHILSTEVSIHVLRGVGGLCSSVIDDMSTIRQKFIMEYEEKYEEYIEYRDFY